ncbi:sialin-like isoform X2 [Haliotis rubra]|uniref:sialin-like isoform X2 n=1 Tax=Haliotis rubra TaxID=36100 RepID=UPI001EE5BB7E|nr:sialin-like isoform X2 [Haliotis rubra]
MLRSGSADNGTAHVRECAVIVPWWRRRRYWLSALLFLGFAFFTTMRANLSIVIVCMVKHGSPHNATNLAYNGSDWSNTTYSVRGTETDSGKCPSRTVPGSSNEQDGEFEWSKELQGVLLGGYFWGYSVGFQILGGWLSQRYGPRKMLAVGMLPAAVGCILSPLAVRISPFLFLAVRIVTGITTSVMFPSGPVFWSRWAPPEEWSRLLTTTNAGGEFGHAIAFPINGLLCKYGGWEMPFYVVGSLSVIWCIVWLLVSRDSPSEMPGITEAEKNYIETSIGDRVTSKRTYKTPWCQMLSSRPVWACVISHMTANFFFYMILTQAPTFLNEILKFDITSNGFYSSLPYVVLVSLVMPIGALSDYLTTKGFLSLSGVRKVMNTLGMLIPAAFLLGLAHLPCSEPLVGVALIAASVGTFAFCFLGHIVNMADIAVMHAGTLAGFSNTLASMPGIIAPYVVGYITKQGTPEEWRTAFYIAVVLNVVGSVVFVLFSTGTAQPWALPAELNTTTIIDEQENPDENHELDTMIIVSNKNVPDSHKREIIEGERLISSNSSIHRAHDV